MDAINTHCSVGGVRGGGGLFFAEGKRVFSSSSSTSLLLKANAKVPLPTCWISARAIFLHRPLPLRRLTAAALQDDENVVQSFIQPESQSQTVHVRIVLEKECLFGQQFLLVGDGPMLGLWDPSNALPLEWSDGHAWKAETDLPIGTSVQFKFILRDTTGEVYWQPGPDRVLRVWETTNTIVVTEDWENVEIQKITEEPLTKLTEDITTESMVGGNDETLSSQTEDVVGMGSLDASNGTAVIDEAAMDVIIRSQVRMAEERMPHSAKGEELSSYEDLVLIPGLKPATVPMAASFFSDEVVNGKMDDASLANLEAGNYLASQVNEDAVESGFPTTCQTKTVHVRFVLEKECLLGQQLLIVGNDPFLGSWDPLYALPFECSNDHVWTAELDLPVGKSVHFKFLLRGISGLIDWQPGPDRILRVPDTSNAIIVTEDWENADNQNILEDPLASLAEDVVSTESIIGINGRGVIDETTKGVSNRIELGIADLRSSQSKNVEELSSREGDLLLIARPVTTWVFPNETTNGKINDASLANDGAENCITSQVSVEQGEPVLAEANSGLQAEQVFAETDMFEEETMPLLEKPHNNGDFQETPGYEEVFSEEKLTLERFDSQSASCEPRSGFQWGHKMLHQFLNYLGLK